jgi:hypothetical protein
MRSVRAARRAATLTATPHGAPDSLADPLVEGGDDPRSTQGPSTDPRSE